MKKFFIFGVLLLTFIYLFSAIWLWFHPKDPIWSMVLVFTGTLTILLCIQTLIVLLGKRSQ